MTLLVGSNSLDTDFFPAAGPFIVQVSGPNPVKLLRKNTSTDTFASVGYIDPETCKNVDNPVSGTVFRFHANGPATTRADQ